MTNFLNDVYLNQQTNKNSNIMKNFTLKFGKHKGSDFLSTPKSYQAWLLSQDWFKAPVELTELQQAQKSISKLSNQLKGWDGQSQKGFNIETNLFEAEKAMDNAIFNSKDQSSTFWDGEMTF